MGASRKRTTDYGAIVLIVEDDPAEGKLILEAFEAQQFRHHVALVADGAAALEYLGGNGHSQGQEPPALILLDLHMPRMDGIEVLNRLRQDKWLKYVPVIVLTGSADDEKRVAALDLGAKFVISKPASLAQYNDLARRVDSLLNFIK